MPSLDCLHIHFLLNIMILSDFSALQSVLDRNPEYRLSLVFGSVASGKVGPDSDMDIAVDRGRPFTAEERIALIESLAVASGRPVDLVDICLVGEPLLGQIVTKGTRLLGTPDRFAGLVVQHLMDEADFLPLRGRVLAEWRAVAWTLP